MFDMTSRRLSELNELHELEAAIDLHRHLPTEFCQSYGAETRQVGACHVLMIPRLGILPFNRIVGLGIGDPATEELLDEAMACLARAGTKDFIAQISPLAEPAQLQTWLHARGFKRGLGTPKLMRGNEAARTVPTSMHLEQVGAEAADQFAEIFGNAFGLPQALWPLFTSVIGKPGWHHYLGFDGAQPVATAAMYVKNDAAWLGFASTRQSHRNRGGQSALIERRIADGLALGCKWFVTETGKDTSELPNPSYRNMLRAGFNVSYIRDNYLFQISGEG